MQKEIPVSGRKLEECLSNRAKIKGNVRNLNLEDRTTQVLPLEKFTSIQLSNLVNAQPPNLLKILDY